MPKKQRTADQTIPTVPPDVLELPRARPSEVGLDKVTIDPKFANLLDPGDENTLLKLYEEIERDGFRDPIVAARLPDGSLILIDGHHRYRIWKKYFNSDPARAPQVVVIDFPDRESAELWIIRNQLCRRNITLAQKVALVLKYEPVIAAQAKENRTRGVCLKSDEGQKSIDTNAVLSEMAGVSRDTYCKAKKVLQHGTPNLVRAMTQGDVSINEAAQAVGLPTKEQNQIAKAAESPETRHKKTKLSGRVKTQAGVQAASAEPRSDQEPATLSDMVRTITSCSRSLLLGLNQSTSRFEDSATVDDVFSAFDALKQVVEVIAPQMKASASGPQSSSPTNAEPALIGDVAKPYKIVQVSPHHFNPRRDADEDLHPESPAAAANAMFGEQGRSLLAFIEGLEPLMQTIRDSGPDNLSTIEERHRIVCQGAESLNAYLILMSREWKLRN